MKTLLDNFLDQVLNQAEDGSIEGRIKYSESKVKSLDLSFDRDEGEYVARYRVQAVELSE